MKTSLVDQMIKLYRYHMDGSGKPPEKYSLTLGEFSQLKRELKTHHVTEAKISPEGCSFYGVPIEIKKPDY